MPQPSPSPHVPMPAPSMQAPSMPPAGGAASIALAEDHAAGDGHAPAIARPIDGAGGGNTARLHALDGLRALALLLGILVHATMSFIPGAQFFWIAADSRPGVVPAVAFHVVHSFRMLLFFLIAGYFARLGLIRRGPAGFAAERARRIAVPMLVGWPLLYAAVMAVAIAKFGRATAQAGLPQFNAGDFPLMHLWFLYLLLGFLAAAVLLHALRRRLDPRDRTGALAQRAMNLVLGPWAPLLLALPMAAALAAHPVWYAWFGIPTPDTGLLPNRVAVVAYGVAFGVGWLLQRDARSLSALRRWAPAFAVLAVAASIGCLAWIGLTSPPLPAPRGAQTLAYAVGYGVAGWAWTLALVGLALRGWSREGRVRRYLADAAYPLYLGHLPLVMALQVWMAPWDLPWPLKLSAILVVATAVLLAAYHVLVRGRRWARWIDGNRPARFPAPSTP